MSDKYRLTDKWSEPFRGLELLRSGNELLFYIPFTQHGWEGNDLQFSESFIKSNPHLFEKVEEKKPKTRFLYGDIVEMVGGEDGEVRPRGERDKLEIAEKKAKAGEELAEIMGSFDPLDTWTKFRIQCSLKKYREAVK